MMFLLFCFLG